MTCKTEKCTRESVFHVRVKFAGTQHIAFERDYCPIHMRGLGVAMAQRCEGYPLHEYLDVEYINA